MPEALQPGVRVTLAMGDAPEPEPSPTGEGEVLPAQLVAPAEPREAAGMYWGYTTRLAAGLSAAITDSPFEVTVAVAAAMAVTTGHPSGSCHTKHTAPRWGRSCHVPAVASSACSCCEDAPSCWLACGTTAAQQTAHSE